MELTAPACRKLGRVVRTEERHLAFVNAGELAEARLIGAGAQGPPAPPKKRPPSGQSEPQLR